MKKLPNAVKWAIILVVLAGMGWMMWEVNDGHPAWKCPPRIIRLGSIARRIPTSKEIRRKSLHETPRFCIFAKNSG